MISAHVTGNLTRDPEIKNVSGNSFTAFDIAVNSKDGAGNKEVTYVDCTANGKTGELIAQYFKKGNTLSIVASLKIRKWKGNDGIEHSSLSASTVMIDWEASQSAPRDQTQPAHQAAQTPPPAQARPAAQPPAAQPVGQPQRQYDSAGNLWEVQNGQWVRIAAAQPPAAPAQPFQPAPQYAPQGCPPSERPF